MRKLLTITFLIIISFECKYLLAQKLNITFEHFSVEQGLPSTVVPCLFQDRTGYLWFGTFYGVARYDGYSIVSYTNRERDSTSITNSIVNAICDDKDGNIWFGHSRGLDKFNPSTEIFTHYILNPDMPLTDWSQHVLSLHEDKDGTLWIGTGGGGLYVFNKFNETFTCFKHDSTNPYSISSNSINSIFEDRSGTLWFATGKGINKFDKARKQFFHYWLPSEKEVITGMSHGVISILEDRDGIFWLGTGGGLAEFNLQTETVTVFKHEPKDPLSLANNIVKSICEDRSGQLWISTKDGVDLFNKKTKIFSHHKHDMHVPGSLGSNDAGEIILDRSGTIWVSTYGGGVNKYTPPNQYFRYYSAEGKYDRFPSSGLIEDKNGTLWLGTSQDVLKFDPENGTFKSLGINKDIYFILEDRTGMIWCSAWNESLCKIDQSAKVSRFKDSNGSEFSELVTAMCNSSNGNIWIGTRAGDVYSINPKSGEINFLFNESNWIETICEDNDGLLWIGIREFGIVCYDPFQKKSTYFTSNPQDSLTISNNNITRITKDKTGNLWIITGRNLNKYDQETRRFKRLKGTDGFPVNALQVTEDGEGNIWISTLSGVVKYNPYTNKFKNYMNIRGMSYKTRSGELYFVGKDGITRFHPDSLKDNPYVPPIVITAFRKFEKRYPFGKEINLSYNENFISFEFAALSFVNPERNQYAYKLEGLEKDWVYSGTRRFASYPNLEPGEYIFRVKGSNNDGIWNEDGTSITIIISPPWWKTSWAYTSYALIFVFSLYGIRRYEMNRLSLKNQIKMDEAVLKEKEETDKMKSRFFANISHEFRTPLTLILGPAEKITSDTSEDIKKDANIIKRNSRRLLQLINQLLDLSKLESGKLKLEASKANIVSFVKGVAISFESLAESKDITLKLLPEKEFIELYFDKEKMTKILTNILSNAFKFTPEEGTITVSVKECHAELVSAPPVIKQIPKQVRDGNIVEIKVRDTGIGIPQDEIPKLFDRFYQVDSSHTREYEGTGIGLALTKELVELHNGVIKVASEKGIYTEFTLEFPLGRDHLKEEEIVEEKEVREAVILNHEKDVQKNLAEDLGVTSNKDNSLPYNDIEKNEDKTIILVVEDNYDMRQYIRESLNRNYLIEEAINGEQGVRKAEKIIPDLIVSDMMMPKMDGNELVRKLKNDEKTSHIPIILLTAKAGQENKLEGLEIGADDYLTKPFDIKELQVRIKNLINIRKKLQEKFIKVDNHLPSIKGLKLSSLDEKFMLKVSEVIENHLSEEEFSIEEFGKEVGMSRAQFHRKFKAITGKPASMFLRSVRLARAKKMIEEQSGNISEIAFSVGFSSPSYFSKCFRDEFGYPPSDSVK